MAPRRPKRIDPRGGALLRAWRVQQALTLTAAGSKLGVVAPIWHGWEGAAKRPRLEHAIALELLTLGDVPIEAFGYPSVLVEQLRMFALRRAGARLVLPQEQARE